MAYGLPARGQQNWDDELNNSIEALRADVESSVSKADVAASDAAYARNRADEVHTAVVGGTDAAVSGFINDDTSATKASLSVTIATRAVGQVPASLLGATLTAETTTTPRVVDRFGGYIWGAIDNKIWRSTDGTSWTQVANPGFLVIRLLPTADGEVLAVNGSQIKKSTGWSTNPATATWTTKLTTTATSSVPVFGFDSDETGQRFIANEYGVIDGTAVKVYMSLDGGNTFTTVYDTATAFPGGYTATHVHGSCYDPWADRWWFTQGHSTMRGAYYSDNNGATWTRVPGTELIEGGSPTTLTPTEVGIVCGSDDNTAALSVIARNDDPTQMRMETLAKWRGLAASGAGPGFANRAYRDAVTGLVYLGFCSTVDATVPLQLWVTNGVRAERIYTLATGAFDNFYQVFAHDGLVLATLTQGGSSVVKQLKGYAGAPALDTVTNSGNLAGATSTAATSVTAGPNASTTGATSVAVGQNASTSQTDSATALGAFASAAGVGSGTAVGRSAAVSTQGTAVGRGATASAVSGGTAVGYNTTVSGTSGIAVGLGATSSAQDGVAVGKNATAAAVGSVAVGQGASIPASNTGAVVIGQATITGSSAIASVVIGNVASTTAHSGIAIGNTATTTGAFSVAVGRDASAAAQDTVALGRSAVASAGYTESVALGYASVTSSSKQVQINDRHIEMKEQAAPANPAVDKCRLYVADNAGKTTLYAKFSDGTTVALAAQA